MNHFSSIIISDISLKYSLKNDTNCSGENFSEILVNHSISEKKIAIFLSSQSRFIFHSSDNISLATSAETYSESALFNLVLFLFSIKYFTILEIARDNINDRNNSIGKFNNVVVSIVIYKTHNTKRDTRAKLLNTNT